MCGKSRKLYDYCFLFQKATKNRDQYSSTGSMVSLNLIILDFQRSFPLQRDPNYLSLPFPNPGLTTVISTVCSKP